MGSKYRSDYFTLVDVGWVIGYCVLPWIALWFHHFRHMTLACLILVIFMVLWFYFYFDESPRWQLVNNKFDDAEKTIKKIMIKNNKFISDQDLKEKMMQLKNHIEFV